MVIKFRLIFHPLAPFPRLFEIHRPIALVRYVVAVWRRYRRRFSYLFCFDDVLGKKSRSIKGNSPDWTHKPVRNGTSVKVAPTSKADFGSSLESTALPLAREGKDVTALFEQSWGRSRSPMRRNIGDPTSLVNPLLALSVGDGFPRSETPSACKGKLTIDRLPHQRSFPGSQGIAPVSSRVGWIWNGHASVDGSSQSLQYLTIGDTAKDGGLRGKKHCFSQVLRFLKDDYCIILSDGAPATSGDHGGFSVGYGQGGNWRWNDTGGGVGSLRPGGVINRRNSISPLPYGGSWSSSSSSSSSSHLGAPIVPMRSCGGQFLDGVSATDSEAAAEPVELQITNLDHFKEVGEMKQYLMALFQEHVMVGRITHLM